MIFFIALLIFFALTDILYMRIPNIVIIPALAIAGIITGNWLWMAVMALMGALFVSRNYWAGGDVKLLALVGAFLTWQAPIVLLVTIALIRAYRRVFSRQDLAARIKPLPVAPFLGLSSFAVIGISQLWKLFQNVAP